MLKLVKSYKGHQKNINSNLCQIWANFV